MAFCCSPRELAGRSRTSEPAGREIIVSGNMKIGLTGTGSATVDDWRAAVDRLAHVTIVDAGSADAVVVDGGDAANQAAAIDAACCCCAACCATSAAG